MDTWNKKPTPMAFHCDECDGEIECTDECRCDLCREEMGQAQADAHNDTYD
jgi:hypothetical protein